MSRFARQRDSNEREIIDALRRIGASVSALDGAGLPDLLVGYGGRTLLLEVKRNDVKRTTRGARTDAQGLTTTQQRWWLGWHGTMPMIVRTAYEAIAVVTR